MGVFHSFYFFLHSSNFLFFLQPFLSPSSLPFSFPFQAIQPKPISMSSAVAHSLVFATAMAVSAGTLILFDLWWLKQLQIRPDPRQKTRHPRPCLAKGGKRSDEKKKKKKRVQFAADVKEPRGNGEKYRRDRRKSAAGVASASSCGMPANRMALYTGMMRDRLQRTQFSY